jgi:peptidoglycan/LPS O-acetylase OafA/YrhL
MERPRGSVQSSAGPESASLFRPDVEACAASRSLVLLFHGAFPVPGGFVGVDVFLVISGYLITGLLLRELETKGSIDLLAFYGRRLRRLLPAASVAIAVVLPLAFVALPPLDRPDAMADGAPRSCARTARPSSRATTSGRGIAVAVPHFWSPSLEQFHLVAVRRCPWHGAAHASRRRSRSPSCSSGAWPCRPC